MIERIHFSSRLPVRQELQEECRKSLEKVIQVQRLDLIGWLDGQSKTNYDYWINHDGHFIKWFIFMINESFLLIVVGWPINQNRLWGLAKYYWYIDGTMVIIN